MRSHCLRSLSILSKAYTCLFLRKIRTEITSLIPHLRAEAYVITGARAAGDDLVLKVLKIARSASGPPQDGRSLKEWLADILNSLDLTKLTLQSRPAALPLSFAQERMWFLISFRGIPATIFRLHCV